MTYKPPSAEKKILFVATPLLDPNVPIFHANGLMEMMCEAPKKIPNLHFAHRVTFPRDIVRARSRLARDFLDYRTAKGEPATHLLFIDGDNVPNSTAIVGMLKAHKDVVACPYPRREIFPRIRPMDPASAMRYSYIPIPGAMKDIHDCVEIGGIGFGFILIRREVVEKLVAENRFLVSPETVKLIQESNLPEDAKAETLIALRNFFFDDFPGNNNKETVAIFSLYNGLDGRMFGEDYSFCFRCRDAGIKVHMYLGDGSPVEHDGILRFTGDVKDLIPKCVPAEELTSEDP